MPEAVAAPLFDFSIVASGLPTEIVDGLHAHELTLRISSLYEVAISQLFLSKLTDIRYTKDIRKFQRILRQYETYRILAIIWKETYCDRIVVESAGLSLAFQEEDLTSHGLAVALAERPNQVAAYNSRIRLIALAAEAYGLVVREPVPAKDLLLNSTNASKWTTRGVLLKGTGLLNLFMLSLGSRERALIFEFVGRSNEESPIDKSNSGACR